MTRSAVRRLLQSYLPHGQVKAKELLLEPGLALELIDGLEQLGVVIDGIDVWAVRDGKIVELLEGCASEGNTPHDAAQIAREYVAHHLSPEVNFVSVVFEGYADALRDP